MKIILAFFRFCLSLRYSVRFKGLEQLEFDGPMLILPNHQATVDPQILMSNLLEYRKTIPVVTEGMYKVPVLNMLFRYLRAVAVSDLSAGSRDTRVLTTITTSILQHLSDGECVLLYPSGQIAGQGYEKIFNKQSAWMVVRDMPVGTRVVGARISGLWGSMWSRAWLGKTPGLISTYLHALWILAANLVFFCPRRKVVVELEDITSYAIKLAQKDVKTFNHGLEQFFNSHGEEKVLFLKHYFYAPTSKRKIPDHIECSVADVQSTRENLSIDVPQTIIAKVKELLGKELSLKWDDATLDTNITLDLGVDSVTHVSIISVIEDSFKVVAPDVTSIKTFKDLCLLAMGVTSQQSPLKNASLTSSKLPLDTYRISNTSSIHQNFVTIFSHLPQEPFAWDNMMGTSTRGQFFIKTMVVAEIIKREVPGTLVGIMLPSLQSSTLLVAATYMAGKTPVMLNWTVGQKILKHCVDSVGLTHVVTATAFFEKIKELLPDEIICRCLMFDKVVNKASINVKVKGLLRSKFVTRHKASPHDVAVILFTSGSESLPKAVPLTHINILSCLQGALEVISLENDTILLSFLPPFHSFGFSVLTILPLVTGLRVAYTPDPTASRDLVSVLKHTRANTLLATPTFLKMMLPVASGTDLQNVRLAVTGAESLSPQLIEAFRGKAAPGALILEGYGITECSPVLTINPPSKQKIKSVGTFIPCVEHLIVDVDAHIPLQQGSEGMILVRGDNIFAGYLDKNIKSPFITVSGKTYYQTGDLGYIDPDGFLFITGRLKRFIKIAGEMVSLPAVEQCLTQCFSTGDELTIAVEGSDSVEPPQIVLFTTTPLDVSSANNELKKAGFSNLIRIHRVELIDHIPVLGTGKIDYKEIRERIC